jgi:hypothetical protein
LIELVRPGVIVVPEGNAPICEVARLAATSAGVRTICIQHGWSPVAHPGFRNLAFDDMLVWGPLFAELLTADNPDQHFTVVGNPNILPMARGPDLERPIRAIGFFLQKGGPLIGPDDWDAFLDLIGWMAVSFPQIEVVIRDHPSTPSLDCRERDRIGPHSNIRLMPPSDHPLTDVLAHCDIVVSAYSTTLLEALAFGAIPVIFGASGLASYHPDLAAMGAAIQVASLEAAKDKLASVIVNEKIRARLRKSGIAIKPGLFAATGVDAVNRIVAAITPWLDHPDRTGDD